MDKKELEKALKKSEQEGFRFLRIIYGLREQNEKLKNNQLKGMKWLLKRVDLFFKAKTIKIKKWKMRRDVIRKTNINFKQIDKDFNDKFLDALIAKRKRQELIERVVNEFYNSNMKL